MNYSEEELYEDEPQEEIKTIKGPLPTKVTFDEKWCHNKPSKTERKTFYLNEPKSFPKGLSFTLKGEVVIVSSDLTNLPDIRFAIVETTYGQKGEIVDDFPQKFSIVKTIKITFHNGPDAEKEVIYTNFKVS